MEGERVSKEALGVLIVVPRRGATRGSGEEKAIICTR